MKDGFIKVAACTPEIRVADIDFNVAKIIEQIQSCKERGVKIAVFPELCVTGSTCGDLFYQEILLHNAMRGLIDIAKATEDYDALVSVGMPVCALGEIFNCAAVIKEGKILCFVPKTYLSLSDKAFFAYNGQRAYIALDSYGLADTKVAFGQSILSCDNIPGLAVGFEIGGDALAVTPVSNALTEAGATIICNLSAGCELVGGEIYRRQFISTQSARLITGYIAASAGDGESTQDMVFSGHNIIAERGKILAESQLFQNGIIISEIDVKRLAFDRIKTGFHSEENGIPVINFSLKLQMSKLTRNISKTPFIPENADERARRCSLILQMQAQALKRRIEHTRANSVVIGISGGLDSCLALLVCVEAMELLGRSRRDVIAVTMPCFGTTKRTRSNAEVLCNELGVTFREVDITQLVLQHFKDIGQNVDNHDVVFENAQARTRTMVIMDIANQVGGFVVGTGDLSELALGWATYNGDHMSMYGVNASIPKTLIRHIVSHYGDVCENSRLSGVLRDIVDTPVSPELLPTDISATKINQKTEDLVGPYELHDFFLYYGIRWGFSPSKVYRLAKYAFDCDYDDTTILKWLKTFYRRFFSQQFKRSCLPDGPMIGSLSLSPRGSWLMPSDACATVWLNEMEGLTE